MKTIFLILLFFALTITACVRQQHTASNASSDVVGNDRDAHGCIGSAGYSWCEKTAQCEHPWELAKKVGFELTDSSFAAFCKK